MVSRLDAARAAIFPLFERHARVLSAGAVALRQMLEGGEQIQRHCQSVMRHEEGGRCHHARCGNIPFDRGDIQGLITAMDDAIDQMQKTAKAIILFEMTSFEPEMRMMLMAHRRKLQT